MASIVAKMFFFCKKKPILLIFVECVLCEFLSYDNDQVVKTHLICQEKMMARTKSSRAHFRALGVLSLSKNLEKCHFTGILTWRAARADVRARAYKYQKWKDYHLRILLNIYIIRVACKLAEIIRLEIWKFLKKSWKNYNFWNFFEKSWISKKFVECVLCEFLSYNNDQVVKTHLI